MPLHARLVHFPIALLLVGALAAILYEWRHTPWLKGWGFIAMLVGWVLTIPAIITGLIDKSDLVQGSTADRLADLHTTTMFAMWALFGVALYWQYIWRDDMTKGRRRWLWLAVLTLASLALLLAGHLGGRLVYELGVGIHAS